MKKVTMDGNKACSNVAYLFSEVVGMYPITPSTPMAENIDKWSIKNRPNIFGDRVEIVEMQSEAGASGFIHGSLQSGLLSTTFTASQGLLLMIPNMYKMAGEMLPGVIHVAARSLSTQALSIMGDHQDIYAVRQTGFCMLSSSSVQDTAYLSAITHLASLKSSLPFLHFFDGFRTSHEINKINILDDEEVINLVDKNIIKKFKEKSLNPLRPITRGTAQNDDIYFQSMEVRNKFYDEVPEIVNEYMEKINGITNSNYKPFNYYGSEKAENIIIAMGSVCGTIKETVDFLNKKNYNIGLIEVHLYRPFSQKFLENVLPKTVKKIAVIDRTKEPGSIGEPLYLDVVSSLKDKNISIVNGRYGLSSKNTTPRDIKAVYDMLNNKLKQNFTIGIIDDVTYTSLETEPNFKISSSDELLIYGYGSDGMVSASKSFIELIGNNSDKYVQSYFEYDSKKSGGVTISHLRINNREINSTYYVEEPKVIVISKDSYLNEIDCLSMIQENGTVIINTSLGDNVINLIDYNTKKALLDKSVKIYTINAYELARKVGLSNKISMIMESVIFKLTDFIDENLALNKLKEDIKNRFNDKGEKVVEANIKGIENVDEYIKEINLTLNVAEMKNTKDKSLFSIISSRKGNDLPVSSFLDMKDGSFLSGTTRLEKKGISDIVPMWINENCIQCNQCSFVCPHGVIRPFLLNQEEFENSPEYIKNRCLKAIGPNMSDLYYIISVSIKNCTGCGLCVNTCPGKMGNKALSMTKIFERIEDKEQEVFDYLVENIKDKNIDTNTIKTSQFKTPCFAFSGACAGCGETSYIKLLTQLYGEKLIIANATGCSSIYGGSVPSTPYAIPWASSLFEDNAEYAYGMVLSNEIEKNKIKFYMEQYPNEELFVEWLNNMDDFQITKKVYENIDYEKHPKLKIYQDGIIAKSIWAIGGDGWAYDIGFGGIDHVMSSNSKIRILVLDTQVYSNTGGQSSKASQIGSVASFTESGKKTYKKDLARILMSYPNAYVAQVSLGANMMQLIKAFKEAENHPGPAIILAYSPCIAHGIKGGLSNTTNQQKLAAQSGYFPLFRYNAKEENMIIDTKNPDFDLYDDFLNSESRYSLLKKINPAHADELLKNNKEQAIKRFEYYKSLEKTS